jgi:hypothetical protein
VDLKVKENGNPMSTRFNSKFPVLPFYPPHEGMSMDAVRLYGKLGQILKMRDAGITQPDSLTLFEAVHALQLLHDETLMLNSTRAHPIGGLRKNLQAHLDLVKKWFADLDITPEDFDKAETPLPHPANMDIKDRGGK